MADTSVGFGLPEQTIAEFPALSAGLNDDERLVVALRAGSETAYEELIQRFQHPVYNLVCRLMQDTDDAADVVQEVFLKVFRNVGSFRCRSSLKTWIYRIAVNEAHNHRRWFSRHRRQEVGLDSPDPNGRGYREMLSDASRSPFDEACDHEAHALVEEALADINPTFRAAVVLRDLEDLNYEEIAQVLQVSLGTVKSRILRGREALRKKLAGRLEPGTAMEWTPQPAHGKS